MWVYWALLVTVNPKQPMILYVENGKSVHGRILFVTKVIVSKLFFYLNVNPLPRNRINIYPPHANNYEHNQEVSLSALIFLSNI